MRSIQRAVLVACVLSSFAITGCDTPPPVIVQAPAQTATGAVAAPTTNVRDTAALGGALPGTVPANFAPMSPSTIGTLMASAPDRNETGGRLARVGQGAPVDIATQIARGKVTIVQFTSPYCGPCQQIEPLLTAAVQRNPGVALRQLDINRPGVQGIDWQSPLATQHQALIAGGIPAFVVYGANGVEVARGEAAKQMVMSWIQQPV